MEQLPYYDFMQYLERDRNGRKHESDISLDSFANCYHRLHKMKDTIYAVDIMK